MFIFRLENDSDKEPCLKVEYFFVVFLHGTYCLLNTVNLLTVALMRGLFRWRS